MKKINKYKWLLLISIFLYTISFIISPKTEDSIKSEYYPLEVIDNEIRVKETGEILYRFIPVDGGTMEFMYQDSIKFSGHETAPVFTYIKDISSFLIGETPVTYRLWNYVMNNQTEVDKNDTQNIFCYYKDGVYSRGWDEFIKRLEKMTGRKFCLPTSFQWEYAARGGNKSKGYVYSGGNNIDDVAFYKGNSLENNLEARSGKLKRANELGLYDMSGSVWELTSTNITEIYSTNKLYDYEKFLKMGISRGGNWKSTAKECELNHIANIIYCVSGARLILKTKDEPSPPIVYDSNNFIELPKDTKVPIAYEISSKQFN